MVVITDVDSALKSSHFVDMDCVADVSKVYSAPIFNVETSNMGDCSCMYRF
jgi:hypothetical protein